MMNLLCLCMFLYVIRVFFGLIMGADINSFPDLLFTRQHFLKPRGMNGLDTAQGLPHNVQRILAVESCSETINTSSLTSKYIAP